MMVRVSNNPYLLLIPNKESLKKESVIMQSDFKTRRGFTKKETPLNTVPVSAGEEGGLFVPQRKAGSSFS